MILPLELVRSSGRQQGRAPGPGRPFGERLVPDPQRIATGIDRRVVFGVRQIESGFR